MNTHRPDTAPETEWMDVLVDPVWVDGLEGPAMALLEASVAADPTVNRLRDMTNDQIDDVVKTIIKDETDRAKTDGISDVDLTHAPGKRTKETAFHDLRLRVYENIFFPQGADTVHATTARHQAARARVEAVIDDSLHKSPRYKHIAGQNTQAHKNYVKADYLGSFDERTSDNQVTLVELQQELARNTVRSSARVVHPMRVLRAATNGLRRLVGRSDNVDHRHRNTIRGRNEVATAYAESKAAFVRATVEDGITAGTITNREQWKNAQTTLNNSLYKQELETLGNINESADTDTETLTWTNRKLLKLARGYNDLSGKQKVGMAAAMAAAGLALSVATGGGAAAAILVATNRAIAMNAARNGHENISDDRKLKKVTKQVGRIVQGANTLVNSATAVDLANVRNLSGLHFDRERSEIIRSLSKTRLAQMGRFAVKGAITLVAGKAAGEVGDWVSDNANDAWHWATDGISEKIGNIDIDVPWETPDIDIPGIGEDSESGSGGSGGNEPEIPDEFDPESDPDFDIDDEADSGDAGENADTPNDEIGDDAAADIEDSPPGEVEAQPELDNRPRDLGNHVYYDGENFVYEVQAGDGYQHVAEQLADATGTEIDPIAGGEQLQEFITATDPGATMEDLNTPGSQPNGWLTVNGGGDGVIELTPDMLEEMTGKKVEDILASAA